MTTKPRSISTCRPSRSRHGLFRLVGGALATTLILGACSSTEVRITPPDDQPATMTLFAEIPEDQISNSTSAPPFSVRVDQEGDVLNINEAQIAVNQIEFGRTTGICVDSTASDDGDACNEAVVSPQARDLPLDQTQAVQFTNTVVVEAGDYDRLELDLHPATLSDANLLGTFAQGKSVRIAGSFNGEVVNAQFSPDASLELPLGGTFPLEKGETGRITLVVDLASWFRAEDGSLIDPRAAAEDSAMAAVVEQNIIESMSARTGN